MIHAFEKACGHPLKYEIKPRRDGDIATCYSKCDKAKEELGWDNLSDGAYRMAVIVIRYHSICCMMIWPLAFTLPNTMRSAGDAKFTMTVSILSMWFVRIALAYLIGVSLHVGLLGVWIAQTLDWVVRAGFYIVRYLGHKWENKSVVRQQEKEILTE